MERAEAVRAVQTLQYSYTQYSQYGLWNDLGSLFTKDAEAIYSDGNIKTRIGIVRYNQDKFGGGIPACRRGPSTSS